MLTELRMSGFIHNSKLNEVQYPNLFLNLRGILLPVYDLRHSLLRYGSDKHLSKISYYSL
jgi:hypothetical protein